MPLRYNVASAPQGHFFLSVRAHSRSGDREREGLATDESYKEDIKEALSSMFSSEYTSFKGRKWHISNHFFITLL